MTANGSAAAAAACSGCRLRKVKCRRDDGATACHRCRQQSLVCVVEPPQKRGPRPLALRQQRTVVSPVAQPLADGVDAYVSPLIQLLLEKVHREVVRDEHCGHEWFELFGFGGAGVHTKASNGAAFHELASALCLARRINDMPVFHRLLPQAQRLAGRAALQVPDFDAVHGFFAMSKALIYDQPETSAHLVGLARFLFQSLPYADVSSKLAPHIFTSTLLYDLFRRTSRAQQPLPVEQATMMHLVDPLPWNASDVLSVCVNLTYATNQARIALACASQLALELFACAPPNVQHFTSNVLDETDEVIATVLEPHTAVLSSMLDTAHAFMNDPQARMHVAGSLVPAQVTYCLLLEATGKLHEARSRLAEIFQVLDNPSLRAYFFLTGDKQFLPALFHLCRLFADNEHWGTYSMAINYIERAAPFSQYAAGARQVLPQVPLPSQSGTSLSPNANTVFDDLPLESGMSSSSNASTVFDNLDDCLALEDTSFSPYFANDLLEL